MRRASLITVTLLGLMVCLLGSTGLFAALTDTARTGTNTVTSAGLAPSADIQLATAEFTGAFVCGDFGDDLSTALITATDLLRQQGRNAFLCVRNTGSQGLASLHIAVDELTDVDQACTGDEADNGDTTCGGGSTGELSSVLSARYSTFDCGNGTPITQSSFVNLAASGTTPFSVPAPAVDQTICFGIEVAFLSNVASGEDVQRAQSDTSTWRFKFIART